MPIWLKEKLFQKKFLFEKLKQHDDLVQVYKNPNATGLDANYYTTEMAFLMVNWFMLIMLDLSQ